MRVKIDPDEAWGWAFEAEDTYKIPASLLMGLVQQESGFTNGVRGGVGEIGIAQFRPTTAKEVGIDPHNPRESIIGAAKYLRMISGWMRGNEHIPSLLAAYNWGVGNVTRKGLGRMPRSTRHYIANISAYQKVFENKLKQMGGREGWRASRAQQVPAHQALSFEQMAAPEYLLEE